MEKRNKLLDAFSTSFILLPILILLIAEIHFRIETKMILIIEVGAVLLEIAFFIIIHCFLVSILKQTKYSIILLSVLVAVVSIINQMKIMYTGEPLTISDFLFASNTGELLGIIKETWIQWLISYAILNSIFLLALIIVGIIAYKNNCILEKKIRVRMFVVTAIIICLFAFPIEIVKDVMLKTVYQVDDRKDYESVVSNQGYYGKYGVFTGMYGQFLEDKIAKPDNYDEEQLENELQKAEREEATWGTPNIIIVFSESFWDIDQVEEITFDKPILENFEQLKQKGILVDMLSPVYGGISSNVEFELLTGGSLKYFNKGYIPYMQLYNIKRANEYPSLIKELRKNGYATKIVSGASGNLFNCDEVYQVMGIEERTYIEDLENVQIKGQYVSDEYLTDQIIKTFSTKEKGKKLFYMTLTMQAHMPYYEDKYDTYDIEIKDTTLNIEEASMLKSYAQGIYDADKQLGRLYQYIQQLEEPSIVIFLGDHLPYLKEGLQDVLQKLSYFNTGNQQQDLYRKYHTQALILSNFDTPQGKTLNMSTDLLLTYVLNQMDINLSDFYVWLNNTKKDLSCSNYFITKLGDEIIYTTELEGKAKEVYEIRRNMQYKFFNKEVKEK